MSLNDFVILSKLGKLLICILLIKTCNLFPGEGSYSQVFKVKRNSDGVEYALKKVTMQALSSRER